jgi:hypothetical protein
MIAVAALFRIIPHPPNFSPVAGDLFYSASLFLGLALLERRFPLIAEIPATA